jgi:hypothetical protein
VISAQLTGHLFGTYYGHIADSTDLVRIIDITANTIGPWVFNNQTTKQGDRADFGFASAGDQLVVEILNETTGHMFASDPAYSEDGTNHAYMYAGLHINTSTPVVFVGMEDLEASEQTDWDYNDSEFFLYNILVSQAQQGNRLTDTPTPEPASLVLIGTSLLAFWRKAKGAKPDHLQEAAS